MSIFEEVSDSMDSARPIGNAEPIVKCVTLALKMFLTLNVRQHPLFDQIRQYYEPVLGAEDE